MASNRLRIGPVALTTTYTTNIFNPGTVTGGVASGSGRTLSAIIRHIRIINKTATAATFRLFIGATGANTAGTEFMGYDMSVAANSFVDWYGVLPMDSTDFLVGGAGTTTALTLEGEGDLSIQ